MIDTHCHLTDPRLGDQLQAVLQRAAAAGVVRMVTIGTYLEDDAAAILVCRGRDNLRCTIGVHPHHVDEMDLARLPELRGLILDPSVVALGEMGLDYHYDRSPKEKQREAFLFQLELARETNKPVVIHCREAIDDCLAIMKDFATISAIYHCFTGSMDEARRILDAGYMLGFTGPITYKKSDDLRAVVRYVPMDRLVVETDAPYLSPEPMRKQKTNEPALVMHTAQRMAEIKGVSLEEIDRLTSENALRFFRWP